MDQRTLNHFLHTMILLLSWVGSHLLIKKMIMFMFPHASPAISFINVQVLATLAVVFLWKMPHHEALT